MVFDPTKDKVLKEKVFDADKAGEKIEVKLVSYNNEDPRIQISRFADGDERKYLRLKRLTINEAKQVRDVLTEFTSEG